MDLTRLLSRWWRKRLVTTAPVELRPESRTIAIGDVHGCSEALRVLIAAVNPGPTDLVVTLGDYIDRGPDSQGVVQQLIELRQRCQLVPLLGNHELMCLAVLGGQLLPAFWLQCGGQETLNSYGGQLEMMPSEHVDFLRSCLIGYETDTHIFIHANYDPDLSLDQQPETLRLWEHITHRIPAPHHSGKTVVVGHTPQPSGQILDLGHLLCIDTYCFGSGCLTAVDLHRGTLWQANRNGHLLRGCRVQDPPTPEASPQDVPPQNDQADGQSASPGS